MSSAIQQIEAFRTLVYPSGLDSDGTRKSASPVLGSRSRKEPEPARSLGAESACCEDRASGPDGSHMAMVQDQWYHFWDRIGQFTTHFSPFWGGLGCSLRIRGFDPWPHQEMDATNEQMNPFWGGAPWRQMATCRNSWLKELAAVGKAFLVDRSR